MIITIIKIQHFPTLHDYLALHDYLILSNFPPYTFNRQARVQSIWQNAAFEI